MRIEQAIQEAKKGYNLARYEFWGEAKRRRLLYLLWSNALYPPIRQIVIYEVNAETGEPGSSYRCELNVDDFEADDWEVLPNGK